MGTISIQFLEQLNWQLSPPNPVLNIGEAHVYRIRISHNLHLLELFLAKLSPAEKDRGSKYLQLKDRQRFVISRGAQRNILGQYLEIPAAQLTFALGDNQKPYLLNAGGAGVRYNISHSGDWIILVVAKATIGVDVEHIDPVFPFIDVLDDNFSKAEISFIKKADSRERFFLLWTRKEALLKASGQGLGEHLNATPTLEGNHELPQTLLGFEHSWQTLSFKVANDYFGSITADREVSNFSFFDVTF